MIRRRMMMKEDVDYSLQYFTLVALQDCKFYHQPFSVDYSVDNGNTWATLGAYEGTPTIQAGTKVMFRGNITPSKNDGVGRFSCTNNFIAEGNVMSLLYGDNFIGQKDLTGKNYVFRGMLAYTSKLKSVKNLSLPATTLANECYKNMFIGCTSLTTAPVLPAITLAPYCYYQMFNGCTSLTTAHVLPATTLADYCYYRMFNGCTSLITAPELPATALADYCYQGMFSDCTALTTAPELPATTLADYCYSAMFNGCTSLTTAPVLPATTLAPWCYNTMFTNCSRLNYIKAMFKTTPDTDYTYEWVRGVAAIGTFVKNSAATWNVTGEKGVPSGWTVQTASS